MQEEEEEKKKEEDDDEETKKKKKKKRRKSRIHNFCSYEHIEICLSTAYKITAQYVHNSKTVFFPRSLWFKNTPKLANPNRYTHIPCPHICIIHTQV